MEQLYKKILLGIVFLYSANLTLAYEIKGLIQLEENWERQIYLSAIRSFDDLHTASEEFVIAAAPIQADGSFHIQGDQLPPQYHLYRLHVVKRKDPVGSLIIGGQEENHYHFVMNNKSRLHFFSKGYLFRGARFQNSSVNQSFSQLKEYIEALQKAPNTPSKINWDFRDKQLEDYLLQYADTTQNRLTALYAIYHLNIALAYPKHEDFLRRLLKRWQSQATPTPYFLQFEQQMAFLQYQQSSPVSPLMGIGVVVALILFLIVMVGRIRKKVTRIDPFLEKQKQLTIQEQKIYQLLANGKANKEISNELNIEVSTVKSHLNNIYSKLGIRSRKEIYNRRNK